MKPPLLCCAADATAARATIEAAPAASKLSCLIARILQGESERTGSPCPLSGRANERCQRAYSTGPAKAALDDDRDGTRPRKQRPSSRQRSHSPVRRTRANPATKRGRR